MGPRANDVVAPPARRELSAKGTVVFNAILQAGLSHDRVLNQLGAVSRHNSRHLSLSCASIAIPRLFEKAKIPLAKRFGMDSTGFHDPSRLPDPGIAQRTDRAGP
jgi:hypothetical protein